MHTDKNNRNTRQKTAGMNGFSCLSVFIRVPPWFEPENRSGLGSAPAPEIPGRSKLIARQCSRRDRPIGRSHFPLLTANFGFRVKIFTPPLK